MKASDGYTAVAVLAIVVTANARNLNIPRQTTSVTLPLDGFTPKPTAPAGLFNHNQNLFRRADETSSGEMVLIGADNNCGYISGRPGAGFACAAGDTCVIFTAGTARPSGALACCDIVTCNFRVECIDYNEYYSQSKCDNGCKVDAFTLKCTDSSLPFCNTISFDGNVRDYWCNNIKITTPQAATTTYRGQTNGGTFKPLVLTGSASSSFVAVSETIGGGGPDITVTATATSGGNDDDNSNGDSGSSTPVGAIVGGVVGGVAALGVLGLALFFFLRKRSRKQAAAQQNTGPNGSSPMVQQQQPGYDPVPQQPPSQPVYYDPSKSPQPQLSQQPAVGGFYPVPTHSPANDQSTTPYPNSPASPSLSNMSDPRASHLVASPSPSYAGFTAPPPGQQPGFQTQQGVIHEAPGSAIDNHRGEMHELP